MNRKQIILAWVLAMLLVIVSNIAFSAATSNMMNAKLNQYIETNAGIMSQLEETNKKLDTLNVKYESLVKDYSELKSETDALKEELETLKPKEEDTPIVSTTNTPVKLKHAGPIYHQLSANDIDMIERVVQHEVGGLSLQYKIYLAELIYNRVVSDKFPNDVHEVLFQHNQFGGISQWLFTVTPDKDTKEAVRIVFSTGKPSHPATAYYNPRMSSQSAINWFETNPYMRFVFEYSETSWNVTYPTRFFEIL